MIRWDMGTRPSFLSATVITLACAVGSLFAQTHVRVATWNIQDVGPRGSDEYTATLAILDRIGADVVGINEFNEIGGTNAEENFYNLADDAGYPFTVLPATNPFGSLRNALLSKYPFVAVTIHTSEGLSGDPGAKDITRLIIEVEIDLGADARVLTIAIEHWKAASGNNNEFRRAVESIRMAQVVGDLVSDQDAYVLMGDVNEELENVPLRPNPFRSLPRGLPQSFSLGADLQAILKADGIVNDPFHHIVDTAQTSLLDAQQLDGNDATFPASGRRIDDVFVSCALADLEPPAEVYDSADEGLPGGLPKYGEPPPPNASADLGMVSVSNGTENLREFLAHDVQRLGRGESLLQLEDAGGGLFPYQFQFFSRESWLLGLLSRGLGDRRIADKAARNLLKLTGLVHVENKIAGSPARRDVHLGFIICLQEDFICGYPFVLVSEKRFTHRGEKAHELVEIAGLNVGEIAMHHDVGFSDELIPQPFVAAIDRLVEVLNGQAHQSRRAHHPGNAKGAL